MPNDTVSSHTAEKGPTTRSSSEALLKEVIPSASTTSNRVSELLVKRTPPTVVVGSKSETARKMKITPSPLRRTERTRNCSSSDRSPSTSTNSCSKKHVTGKKLTFGAKDAIEDERNDAGTSSKLNVRSIHARNYRASFQILNRDCPKEPNSTDKTVDRSIPEDSKGGSKIDECFRGNGLNHKAVSKDGTLPSGLAKVNDVSAESRLTGSVKKLLGDNATLGSGVPSNATTHETSVGALERVQSDCNEEELPQMLGSTNSYINENSIRGCNGHAEAENLPSSKRKSTVMDMDSDISATLVDDDNCNLIVDACQSRLCCNILETSVPFSKRIRGVNLPDVQRDPMMLINNVDSPSSKYNNQTSPARKNEGKTGDSVEKPHGNNVETEKIRKQQRSLHLSLKPGIVKLCEILQLPDNIKIMVENCLEFTMDNYQISTEPVAVSILQAFQLSLCCTAASLLRHKLDLEASLVLAKRHLNFDCKKDVVDEINARLLDLKDNLLLLTGNSKVIGSPKASELHSVYSNTEVTPEVELTEKDISESIKGNQKRKNKWRELLHMQQEHKHKLEKDIESEKAYFVRRCKIELAAIRSCSSSDGMRNEKLKVFNSQYDKRKEEMRSQHEVFLKDLQTKQLEARRKFQESWAPDELLNLDFSKELGTPSNAPIILLPYDVADVNKMEIMASKDGPVSGNKGHGIDENDDQRIIISKHSDSRERHSDGATSMADVGEGCGNFSCEFHDNRGQPTVKMVLPSSNREICDGEASNVPDGEVAPALHKTSSSNDDSSLQGKLDGTILSEPVCGFSTNVKANGFIDSDKTMVSSNSQAPDEHIPSVSTISMLNCKDTAQIHEACDGNGSTNAGTMNSPLSDETLGSFQDVHGINVMCMPNGQISEQIHEDDGGNDSHNVVTLNSLLNDERSSDGNLLDREVHEEMPETIDITPLSMEQISAGAVNVSVSNKVLPSSCGTASLNANAINLLNQPSLEKQNPFEVSSSIPAGQNPVEVSETSHGWASASELDREAVVELPSAVKITDYPANAAPLSSPTDQISDGGFVDEVLLSTPCTSSIPGNGYPTTKQQMTTNGQISVIVAENSHEQAECQLTDNVVVNISSTPDHQEGVHKTMTENTLSQETPVSTPVDIAEPQKQVHPLSPVASPYSPVDMLPANQSNHVSMVMEPPEKVQQLHSSVLPYSDQDLSNLHLVVGEDLAATNEDSLCSQIPGGSTQVQNQAREQPPLNLEVDPHQSVVSLVSNMVHDSLVSGGVRAQYSDIRNLSTPGVMNNHPIQTVTRSTSRIAPPLCLDPLSNEFDRLRKLKEQHKKNHEDARLQLECDFEKEREEIRRKYLFKLKEIEAVFQKARENQERQLSLIYRHKILSEAFTAVKSDHVFSYPGGKQQDAGFSQLSRQQNTIATPSSRGPPPAASLQSLYATTGSQAMVPPHMHPAYNNTSGFLSGVSARLPQINSTSPPLGNHQAAGARPPHINSISSSLGNLHTGGEIRTPAPHLQPYRPPTTAPSSSLNTVPHGMPSHPALGNSSASYLLYSQWRPQPMPTISQSDPHRGHWPENTSGFPTPNVSAMDANNQFSINLSNAVPCMSDLALLDPSKSCTSSMPANSAHDATHPDVVCLSDDD